MDTERTHVLDRPFYYRYWGKAGPSITTAQAVYHLLPYHALDVAAVGHVLLHRHAVYRGHFQRLTGLDEPTFVRWFTFLLALHDIGKFADSFQNLNPAVLYHLQHRSSHRTYGERHDSLGWLLWKEHLRPQWVECGIFQVSGSRRRQTSEQPIDLCLSAMVGHHGQPPKPVLPHPSHSYFELDTDLPAASAFVEDLIPLLLDRAPVFPVCDRSAIQLASWWLSGLAVLCDWLGSNTRFFPYQTQVIPLADYWQRAQIQARQALQETGISAGTPSVSLTLTDLIDAEPNVTPEATPLQQTVAAWDLSDSPQLFILEDVTGAGKTEAAVLLAHRLMQAGLGTSLYFALPTMATANTMYSRMRSVYRKLFAVDATPSLVLAHGASDLSDAFRQSVLPETPVSSALYGDGTSSADAHCNAWLADHRKKALLADMGIGTIDQVLLAILPTRHQSLRLLGLVHKILLIDEVHACDAYMHELLCALLRAHAVAGGSVILLSATLPHKQRQALLSAYAEGRNWPNARLQTVDDHAYPLISCLDTDGLRERIVATRDRVKRTVATHLITDLKAVDATLAETVAAGQCACWIRNTVKDAIEAYQHIRQQHPDWSVDLFHARFALGDRLAIEQRVVRRFNKDSHSEQRRGQILIATQVVEQSLDLDFDTLITDLAPMDLLIQRAGRLRRHARDRAGNRVNDQDQRGDAVLHIHSPVVTDTPASGWYADFFPNAQKVYAHHGQLWLTARLLAQQGCFSMPEDARRLIEGVYGIEAQMRIPEALLHASDEAEGSHRADASIARLNALSMAVGYSDASTNRWWDEAKTPTRLGEETTQVYLARWQDGQLFPWFDDPEHSWPLSTVSMRTHWIASEATTSVCSHDELERFKAEQLPAKGKWGVLLPLQSAAKGDWQGVALNEQQETIRFVYNDQFGLMVNVDSESTNKV